MPMSFIIHQEATLSQKKKKKKMVDWSKAAAKAFLSQDKRS